MIKNPTIVCAASRNRDSNRIITGARHFDKVMSMQIQPDDTRSWEQGFIDQYGDFHTREEAMKIVKANGQPFNAERNGNPENQLFSEGLY
jgi:hypothetical protein